MYGDTAIMRKRSAQLREQGVDLRALADQLVAQADGISWTGRAADAMRGRIRDRAAQLRDCAADHETAAESLERHLTEVDDVKESISGTERTARSLVADARARMAEIDRHDDPAGVRREPTPEDRALVAFTPPPTGHKDWLSIDLPGLR